MNLFLSSELGNQCWFTGHYFKEENTEKTFLITDKLDWEGKVRHGGGGQTQQTNEYCRDYRLVDKINRDRIKTRLGKMWGLGFLRKSFRRNVDYS